MSSITSRLSHASAIEAPTRSGGTLHQMSCPPAATSQLPRLVVVDDDEAIRDMLADYLGQSRFHVRTASGGAALDRLLAEEEADALILDVNMPDEDGLSIARRMRAAGGVPIILLTAADDVVDKIVGLEVGADDYMTKPFDLRELRARLRAVLRRSQPRAQPNSVEPPARASARVIPFGAMFVDAEAHCLVDRNGTTSPLTVMEFDLIQVFLQNPNRVLSRDRLLDLAHNREIEPFDRSIDVRITRIRKKIEPDPAKPQTLRTMRGAGYIYTPLKQAR